MPSLIVFILDLNGSNHTIHAVRSVLDCNYKNVVINVLINGSAEIHAEKITTAFANNENVVVYNSDTNLGFAGGNNYLLSKSMHNENIPRYILLLNNDAHVEPDSLSCLESVLADNPKIGIVGPRICKSETNIIESDGVRLSTWFMQQSFKKAGKEVANCRNKNIIQVPFVSGTCMMIRARLFFESGGFDEQYFAYFEDLDLCLRVRKTGYKCFHVPNAVIGHIGSLTTGKDSFLYHYLMTRNRYLIASKHLSPVILYFIFVPYFLIFRILYKTVALCFKGAFEGIKGIYMALTWVIVPVKYKARFWPINKYTLE